MAKVRTRVQPKLAKRGGLDVWSTLYEGTEVIGLMPCGEWFEVVAYGATLSGERMTLITRGIGVAPSLNGWVARCHLEEMVVKNSTVLVQEIKDGATASLNNAGDAPLKTFEVTVNGRTRRFEARTGAEALQMASKAAQ